MNLLKKQFVMFNLLILISICFLPLVSTGTFENETEKKSEQYSYLLDPLPDYFSWKDYQRKDLTTSAKDQSEFGYCGSCWAFAPIGMLESVIKIREGNAEFNPDLSEQYIISCHGAGNIKGRGCCGGYPTDVFQFIIDTTQEGNNCNGVVLESYFPYSARRFHYVPCSNLIDGWEEHIIPIADWGYKILNKSNGERDWIKRTIMDQGPVVADIVVPLFLYSPKVPLIDPLHRWGYNNHDSDAYFPSGRTCSIAGHVVCIVGWKDDDSIQNGGYWICKNSWGTDWGYDGFANIEYGSMNIDKSRFPFDGFILWVDYNPDDYAWPFEK